MSLATFFFDKCQKKIEENLVLLMSKLSNPGSLVTFEASGALVDAVKGGMGALGDFAGDYITKNADAILIEALEEIPGADRNSIMNAFNLVNNIIAAALMANNEVILFFMKRLADNIIIELAKKEELLLNIAQKVAVLHNYLLILTSGDKFMDNYVAKLRSALGLVVGARTDFRLVRSTLRGSDMWLTRRFASGKDKLEQARSMICPVDDNPAFGQARDGGDAIKSGFAARNFLADREARRNIKAGLDDIWDSSRIVANGLFTGTPITVTEDQEKAAVAIPALSRELLKDAQGYFEVTLKINGMLSSYKSALTSVSTAMPDYIKRYVGSLLDKLVNRTDTLVGSMALTLNGSETSVTAPLNNFKPNFTGVSVASYKWLMDLELILNSLQTIPQEQLGVLEMDGQAVRVYQESVRQLKQLNNISGGGVLYTATEAEEALTAFESQLVLFILEANNAVISSSVREGILGVARAMLSRISTTMARDHTIAGILQSFLDVPLPSAELVDKIGNGLVKVLQDVGMDNALGLLEEGKFNQFFKLNAKEATLVGSGLVAIAALKQCFPSDTDRERLSQIEDELERDADLINIKFAIDFDLAIFKNLQDCLRLNSLGRAFNLQELLCKIVDDSGAGKGLSKLSDVLSF